MKARWLSAAVGIPVFVGLVFWGEVPFAAGVLVVSLLSLAEMVRSYQVAGIRLNPIAVGGGIVAPTAALMIALLSAGAIGNLKVILSPSVLLFVPVVWLVAAMTWAVVSEASTGELKAGQGLGYGLLAGLYLSLFGGLAGVRLLGDEPLTGSITVGRGVGALLLTVFCVWATDSFALFVGKAFGKHKLAPKLSPGKTVEGAIGGLAFGVATGALFGWLFFRDVPLGLTIGAIAGVFGQIGDLFESALKRELGIKDFGGIIPGHGGVLDRFDSLLFVAPLACLVFSYWR
jgi:phosphatidate cytidylyltransferase